MLPATIRAGVQWEPITGVEVGGYNYCDLSCYRQSYWEEEETRMETIIPQLRTVDWLNEKQQCSTRGTHVGTVTYHTLPRMVIQIYNIESFGVHFYY